MLGQKSYFMPGKCMFWIFTEEIWLYVSKGSSFIFPTITLKIKSRLWWIGAIDGWFSLCCTAIWERSHSELCNSEYGPSSILKIHRILLMANDPKYTYIFWFHQQVLRVEILRKIVFNNWSLASDKLHVLKQNTHLKWVFVIDPILEGCN